MHLAGGIPAEGVWNGEVVEGKENILAEVRGREFTGARFLVDLG